MTIHELYIDEMEWSSYLLNIKSDVILEPDDELLIDDFIVLIAQGLNQGKGVGKLIIKQISGIFKNYRLRGDQEYWKLFLKEPENYHEILANYLIERAKADPV
jgi:hypothetical protein